MIRTPATFFLTAKLLHWLSVVVILWATVSGLYITFIGLAATIEHHILEFNISLTAVFIPFFLWRVVYRVKHGVPGYNGLLSPTEIKMAETIHIIFYILVSIVLLTGVLMLDEDVRIFNLFSMPQLIHDTESLAFFKSVHTYSSRILAVGIVLHVLAVIKHELSGKRVFKRML